MGKRGRLLFLGWLAGAGADLSYPGQNLPIVPDISLLFTSSSPYSIHPSHIQTSHIPYTSSRQSHPIVMSQSTSHFMKTTRRGRPFIKVSQSLRRRKVDGEPALQVMSD